jgi:undecaprenyl pyrophosphate synthase
LINKFTDFLPDLQKNNIKFDTIGDIKRLPEESQKILQKVKESTKNNT